MATLSRRALHPAAPGPHGVGSEHHGHRASVLGLWDDLEVRGGVARGRQQRSKRPRSDCASGSVGSLREGTTALSTAASSAQRASENLATQRESQVLGVWVSRVRASGSIRSTHSRRRGRRLMGDREILSQAHCWISVPCAYHAPCAHDQRCPAVRRRMVVTDVGPLCWCRQLPLVAGVRC